MFRHLNISDASDIVHRAWCLYPENLTQKQIQYLLKEDSVNGWDRREGRTTAVAVSAAVKAQKANARITIVVNNEQSGKAMLESIMSLRHIDTPTLTLNTLSYSNGSRISFKTVSETDFGLSDIIMYDCDQKNMEDFIMA